MKTTLVILFAMGLVGSMLFEKEKVRANADDWSKVKYFSVKEFDCPNIPLSGYEMDKDFIYKLDAARELAGVPFEISSGYRSPSYNRSIGGVSNSAHVLGRACDIKVTDNTQRLAIVTALITVGFNRLGIYASHIHVDNDPDKPQEIMYRSNEH